MVSKPLSINLLKKDQQSFVDKFIHWALSVGRMVVILTEAIALCAFIYRFTLDRQLIDIHDEIKKKQAYINLLADNEKTYRSLQDRILLTTQYSKNANTTTQSLTDIIALAPSDMFLTNISASTDRIRIEGTIQSIKSLSRFIEKLKNYTTVASVSLDKVENRTSSSTISVSITATFKKTGTPVRL